MNSQSSFDSIRSATLGLCLLAVGSSTGHAQQQLDIRPLSGNEIRLEWLVDPGGSSLILDQSSDLGGTGAGWRPLPIYPETTGGDFRSVTSSQTASRQFFRLREDSIPTEIWRTPIDSLMEEISWDFTYLLARLESSTDAGETWTPVPKPPSIRFETGEFFVTRPLPAPGESLTYRLRQNSAPVFNLPGSVSVGVGEQLVITLSGIDADGDLLRYEVSGLPAGAVFDPLTNKITVRPELATIGTHVIHVTISDSGTSTSAEFHLTVPDPPARTTTALSGHVFDANAGSQGSDVPIAGVTVSLLNTSASTVTDAGGAFSFEDVPAGTQVLNFDPSGVVGPGGLRYAGFREDYALQPLIANRISRPIYLPRLAVDSLTQVVTDQETVVENTAIGVKIVIPPNTAMAGGSSSFTGELSISDVPRGFEPAAMPDDLQPAQIVTIQPVGVTFSQPVPITFPNRTGLAPGAGTEIWSLDAGTGKFIIVAIGQVSADGLRIETKTGGIRATDWHFPMSPPPSLEVAQDSGGDGGKCPAGSEFTLHTGDLTTSFTSAAWLSLGLPNELRFFYSSRQAQPQITVPIVLQSPGEFTSSTATVFSPPQAVAVGGSILGSGSASSPAWIAGGTLATTGARTAVGVSADHLPTGVQCIEIATSSLWRGNGGESRRGKRTEFDTPVVNRSQSPYGMGWSVAGVQSIHVNPEIPDAAMVVNGDTTRVFKRQVDLTGGQVHLPADLINTGTLAGPTVQDFDDDGIPDLAMIHNLPGGEASLVVLRGRGDGTLAYLYKQAITSGTISAIETADLNQDGLADLVLASYDAAGTSVYSLIGRGDGGFITGSTSLVPGVNSDHIAIGDIHGDGIPDVAVGSSDDTAQASVIATLRGNADGSLGNPVISAMDPSLHPSSVGLADLNGDGHADLIGKERFSDSVIIGISDGVGDFTVSSFQPNLPYRAIHYGDFDGNGTVDLQISAAFGGFSSFYSNGGNGTFTLDQNSVARFPTEIAVQPIRAAEDVNGDGDLDIVMQSRFNHLSVASGDGNGAFVVESYIAHKANPDWPAQATPDELGLFDSGNLPDHPHATGDFDGDGRADIVAVSKSPGYNSVSILRGASNGFRAPRYVSGGEIFTLDVADITGRDLDVGIRVHDPIVATGDFDNDGADDVVYSSSTSSVFHFRAGRGDGTFTDATVAAADDGINYLPEHAERYQMLAADFDQDGNLDVVFSTTIFIPGVDPDDEEDQFVDVVSATVLYGNGDGTFTGETSGGEPGQGAIALGGFSFDGQVPEVGIAVGDTNGDGFPDIVLSMSGFDPVIGLYDPTDPRGLFDASPLVDYGQDGVEPFVYSHVFAAGDLNNDGLADFVFFNNVELFVPNFPDSLFMAAFVSRGDGTFTRVKQDFSAFTQGMTNVGPPANFQLDATAEQARIADVNADGRADLIFSHNAGLYLMTGDGTGQFSAPRQLIPDGAFASANALEIGDMTGDGAPDIIINVRFHDGDDERIGRSATAVLPNVGGSEIFGPMVALSVGMSEIAGFVSVNANLNAKRDILAVTKRSSVGDLSDVTSPFVTLVDPLSGSAADPADIPEGVTAYDCPTGDFTTLVRLADGTWQRSTKEGTVFFFDVLGRQVASQDPRNRTVTYEYLGDSERISKITDAGGREINFTYAGAQLSSVDTPVGQMVMRYEEAGHVPPGTSPGARLTSVTFPGGAKRRFTYGTQESNQ